MRSIFFLKLYFWYLVTDSTKILSSYIHELSFTTFTRLAIGINIMKQYFVSKSKDYFVYILLHLQHNFHDYTYLSYKTSDML
jgi:hypothetical protein